MKRSAKIGIKVRVAEQRFPKLARLSLDRGPGEHRCKIPTSPLSGDDWHEAGVLVRLLDTGSDPEQALAGR
jgi:hypothetical protein